MERSSQLQVAIFWVLGTLSRTMRRRDYLREKIVLISKLSRETDVLIEGILSLPFYFMDHLPLLRHICQLAHPELSTTISLSDSPAGQMYYKTQCCDLCLFFFFLSVQSFNTRYTMVRYPRNLLARAVSRNLTIFMAWWLYKIPGAYSMPTDLLATTLARLLTVYLQLQYYRMIGAAQVHMVDQLKAHFYQVLGLRDLDVSTKDTVDTNT
ncbi:uncharacterized protein YALI1_B18391g [Yarrowia lipolytica]|uniref:Uncharacterized protein n=1 Tax=Yarrowia lipolytica TaxID=4952 RepID=A0A1D8N7Q3_YARLL|nr:hypothetical protein YALI1_B18391g [Yarrowia lipolytica]